MTQLNKTTVPDREAAPVGVLTPQPRSGAVSAASGRGRHTTRISVSLPVLVHDSLGTREQAITHSVFSRGAVLVLKSNVHVAQKVTIQNLKNGKSAECHVIGVENMVNQVHKVEVEFTQPQTEFWPVLFPQDNEENNSPGMGNGRPIDSGHRGEPSGSSASRLAKPVADSQHIAADPLLESGGEPQFVDNSDIALVLAAPIKQESLAEPAFHVKSFSASAATMDSVAQFRAATRSASRRKQQIRGISFAGSVALMLCAFFAAKTVLRHHPLNKWQINKWQSSNAAIPQMASASPYAQPEGGASDTTNIFKAPSSDTSPAPISQPVNAPDAILTASSGGEQITLEAPTSGPSTEIAVRHGSTLSSERNQSSLALSEDEPIALPLRSAAETRPEAEINQVLNRTPRANAVLAPQAKPVLRPARLLSTVQPEYPATARQYRMEGEVVMTVEVDASGNVAEVKILSGPPMLRIAAASAVRRWRYQPATFGDKPVASSMTAKLDFRLR